MRPMSRCLSILVVPILVACDGEVDPDAWMLRRARVECRAEDRCAGDGVWFERSGGVEACVDDRLANWSDEIEVRGLVFLSNNARQCVAPHRRAWRGDCDSDPAPESGLNGECELSVWYPEAFLD